MVWWCVSCLAPYYGSLFSYTRIINDAYPDVYYSLYYVNGSSLIPAVMDSMIIKGYQELLVIIHVSVDSLLTSSQRFYSSRSSLNFTVYSLIINKSSLFSLHIKVEALQDNISQPFITHCTLLFVTVTWSNEYPYAVFFQDVHLVLYLRMQTLISFQGVSCLLILLILTERVKRRTVKGLPSIKLMHWQPSIWLVWIL